MSAEAQVRVAGPSRGVLAAATGALVALTSGATAFVVLTGTGGVVPAAPSLEPLPPAAAPPSHPPVVVLPPGALGLPAPAQVDGPRAATPGGARRTTPFVLAAPPASVGLRALVPGLPSPVTAPPAVAVPDAGPDAVPDAGPDAAPPPDLLPVTGPPSAGSDPKLVRRLDKTLDRRQERSPGREVRTPTTDAPALDLFDTMSPSAVPTSTEHRWDEQDEREQRHARSARRAVPAVPAVPAVVTRSRAIPAVPPAVAPQGRRTPSVVQERATRPQQRSSAAAPRKAAASSSAGSRSTGPKPSAGKKSAGEKKDKKNNRASRARSGGPRP